MTTKDFVDCPESEEEEEYIPHEDELKFPYDSLEEYDEDEDSIDDMETRKLKLGQWASKNYPPPPSSRPPRLPVSNVRSPSSSTSSSSGSEGTIIMKGQLNLGGDNSRLPVPGSKGTSRAASNSPHKTSPTTVSVTPTSSSSSEATPTVTPTRDLVEGPLSGRVPHYKASSGNGGKTRRLPSSSSASQPTIPSHLEGGEGGVVPPGILLSPQLRRTPRSSSSGSRSSFSSPSSSLGKPIYRSDSLQSFSSGVLKKGGGARQGFLQSKVPSVASRILQFEPVSSRGSAGGVTGGVVNSATVGMSLSVSAGAKGAVGGANDGNINEEDVTSSSGEEQKLSPTDQKTASASSAPSPKSFDETDHQFLVPSISATPPPPPSTDQQSQTIMSIASTTSSMEELSLYNQEHSSSSSSCSSSSSSSSQRHSRPEAVVPPHMHTAPVPTYPVPGGHAPFSHHPIVFTRGSAPTYQSTQTVPASYGLGYPPHSTYMSSLDVLKSSSGGVAGSGGQKQPLGLATAALALAHNSAANGDVVTLRKLLSSGEVDALSRDEYGSTLLHTAATYGQLYSLQLLSKEISPSALLLADNNFLTPPLLSIQNGHVECLKYLVEELGTPLMVPEAGGETLLHHAAFHGQTKCLEFLIHKTKKSSESVGFVDESGVSPAHFAAQRGHLDCLRLMIDYGLDVTAPDRENMRPADWADATGQHSCTHYLLMYELCWQLSRDVSILTRDIEMLRHENNQLHDLLDLRDKEHHSAIAKLHQQHQETIQKFHEQYAGITVSALLRGEEATAPPLPTSTGGMGKVGSSPGHKTSLMSKSGGGGKGNEGKEKKRVKIAPEPLTIEEIEPHEVFKRELSNVEQRLNASREKRKLHPVMATRSFSPLSPIVKRMNSIDKEEEKNETNEDKNNQNEMSSFLFEGVEDHTGGTKETKLSHTHHHNDYHHTSHHHTDHHYGDYHNHYSDNRHGDHRHGDYRHGDHHHGDPRSMDTSVRMTSQKSPPQDLSRQPPPFQRSPPQEITSHQAPPLQRSPPQDVSRHVPSQRSSSQRSPPHDEALRYHQNRVSKEAEPSLSSSFSINDFTYGNYKYPPQSSLPYKPQHVPSGPQGKTSNYPPHHHGVYHQQQQLVPPPSSSKHKSKGSDQYAFHSSKSQTHTGKTQTHSSKTQSHTSGGMSKLQSLRSYSGKEGHRGGGGEVSNHPLSVTHSSPQHKTKYS